MKGTCWAAPVDFTLVCDLNCTFYIFALDTEFLWVLSDSFLIFNLILFLIICEGIHIYVSVIVSLHKSMHVLGGQKKFNFLNMELQAIVSFLMWVLELNSGPPRAAQALNQESISPPLLILSEFRTLRFPVIERKSNVDTKQNVFLLTEKITEWKWTELA